MTDEQFAAIAAEVTRARDLAAAALSGAEAGDVYAMTHARMAEAKRILDAAVAQLAPILEALRPFLPPSDATRTVWADDPTGAGAWQLEHANGDPFGIDVTFAVEGHARQWASEFRAAMSSDPRVADSDLVAVFRPYLIPHPSTHDDSPPFGGYEAGDA